MHFKCTLRSITKAGWTVRTFLVRNHFTDFKGSTRVWAKSKLTVPSEPGFLTLTSFE